MGVLSCLVPVRKRQTEKKVFNSGGKQYSNVYDHWLKQIFAALMCMM